MAEHIEREATIEKLNKLCDRVCQYSKAQRKYMCGACPLGDAFTVIEDDIPAADVREVKRGKWEEVEVIWLVDIEDKPDAIASMFCPKCKRYANHVYHYGNPTDGMNFCPNCGARMVNDDV